MYAQMVDTGVRVTPGELDEQERRFQARIDEGIRVEPQDWMTARR
jgi:ring-1,2-phenylacetyl-CoA epoxidase subunit PaaA